MSVSSHARGLWEKICKGVDIKLLKRFLLDVRIVEQKKDNGLTEGGN